MSKQQGLNLLTARKAAWGAFKTLSRGKADAPSPGFLTSQIDGYVLSRSLGFCEVCGRPAHTRTPSRHASPLRLMNLAAASLAAARRPDQLCVACPECVLRLGAKDDHLPERARILKRFQRLEDAMEKRRFLLVTAAILLDDAGRVLLAQRKRRGPAEARWEFPGGTVESGEELEDCLVREIFEELEVRIECPLPYLCAEHVSASRFLRLYAFLAMRPLAEIRLRDHLNARWVSPKDLAGFHLEPADVAIAESLAGMGQPVVLAQVKFPKRDERKADRRVNGR